eukprot:1498360-Pyramimonas_sp.AAC.1
MASSPSPTSNSLSSASSASSAAAASAPPSPPCAPSPSRPVVSRPASSRGPTKCTSKPAAMNWRGVTTSTPDRPQSLEIASARVTGPGTSGSPASYPDSTAASSPALGA